MENSATLIETGHWSENITWELFATSTPPSDALCTAVMGVAIADGKVVLACSERGWGMLGGHIEDAETLHEALVREALEEGGFVVKDHKQFAVRKITALKQVDHGRENKAYPFPTSYIVYYWLTTDQPLLPPTGEEIIESGSFTLAEVAGLKTPDQSVIELGWQACQSKATKATRLNPEQRKKM
jgi:8-oxo-dGTP pyrophosphatase MutT (NUDIX family)